MTKRIIIFSFFVFAVIAFSVPAYAERHHNGNGSSVKKTDKTKAKATPKKSTPSLSRNQLRQLRRKLRKRELLLIKEDQDIQAQNTVQDKDRFVALEILITPQAGTREPRESTFQGITYLSSDTLLMRVTGLKISSKPDMKNAKYSLLISQPGKPGRKSDQFVSDQREL